MDLARYAAPPHDRLRRLVALRAMLATGSSTDEVAAALGLSTSAVRLELGDATGLDFVHPEVLLAAASPVLRTLAESHGYDRIAVFGSAARGEAHESSDIDLLVQPPAGTSTFAFLRFKRVLERTLGAPVDLVSYGSLRPRIDDDIRRDARLL